MKGRAWRRAAIDRIKKRVRHYYDGWGGMDPKITGKLVHTRKLCSDVNCCGNRRATEGPTMRERRFGDGEEREVESKAGAPEGGDERTGAQEGEEGVYGEAER